MIHIAPYNALTGAILYVSSIDETSLEYQPKPLLILPEFIKDLDDTHYVRMGELVAYTAEELQAKRNIPLGCEWDVQTRQVIDRRSKEQKAIDNATVVARNRASEYPPLTDLADALYWQSQGDNTKMETYLAACEAVKLRFPKPS